MKKTKYTPAETALLKRISNNIKHFRKKTEVSQEELADLSEIDRTYMGSIERCETNVSILKLKKVADALRVDVSKLLEK